VKKHVKNGKMVSMGFGFVEFDSVETATSVCKDLQVAPIPPSLFLFTLVLPKYMLLWICSMLTVHVFIGNGSRWTCFDPATVSWEERRSSFKEE
jgi:hypothetical protein